MNTPDQEMELFYRHHKKRGNYVVVKAVEGWRTMPPETKARIAAEHTGPVKGKDDG